MKKILKIALLLICLSSTNCMHSNDTVEKQTETTEVTSHKVNLVFDFTGTYSGNFNGVEIWMDLKDKNGKITGNLTMNGEQATVNALANNNTFNGKITENQSRKTYEISGEIKQELLHFFITFPEFNNQTAEIILQKTAKTSTTNKNINPKLVGTWRYTDVISSGSGANYMSFSTDYFVKFNPDGTFVSWTGKSAGGSQNSSISSAGGKDIVNLNWYTSGKELILIDPQTQKTERINFYAENDRIMLSTSKSKRVYQRVNF